MTLDEDKKLSDHFDGRDGRAVIPMLDVYKFALASSRRQEEITRLRWVDLDRAKGIAWLDDMKHSTKKKKNRRAFRLLEQAWEIVDRQPRTHDQFFPYDPGLIGGTFSRARKFLGIMGPTFHDLRHEATSRLFDADTRFTRSHSSRCTSLGRPSSDTRICDRNTSSRGSVAL